MICVGCWMPLSVIQWLMHTLSHLKLIFYSSLLTTDTNNHTNCSSWSLDLLFPPFLFFPPDPAPFIILMQQKWRKKNSRSHFINCCCEPKHISSLKHLDISVIEHFFPLPWWNMLVSPVCVCPCVHAGDIYKVCERDVQSSKLKQREDWTIDGSINWYTVLVMSSVRGCMSLFYGLHLEYYCLHRVYLFPLNAINIYWHSNEHFSIILCDFIISEAYREQ